MDNSLLMTLFTLSLTGLGAVLWFGFRGLMKGQGDLKDQLTTIDKSVALSKQAFETHLKEDERRIGFLENIVVKLAGKLADHIPES